MRDPRGCIRPHGSLSPPQARVKNCPNLGTQALAASSLVPQSCSWGLATPSSPQLQALLNHSCPQIPGLRQACLLSLSLCPSRPQSPFLLSLLSGPSFLAESLFLQGPQQLLQAFTSQPPLFPGQRSPPPSLKAPYSCQPIISAPPVHCPQVSPALTSQPLAMAKPPPRRRMIFQGTVSWAFFQLSRGSVSELGARWRKGPSSSHGCLTVGRHGNPGAFVGTFGGPRKPSLRLTSALEL